MTVILSKRFPACNVTRHFDFKRFDHNTHVLAWIFFIKMFPHLRLHVVFPEVQNLPLIACERLQHFPHVVAAVKNVPHFPGLQRQTFDNGKFQACRRVAMANGSDSRQINGMLPLRAVIGLNYTA